MVDSISVKYVKLLENINQEIHSIDEERFDSETVRSLCLYIDSLHRNFWYEHSATVLNEQRNPDGVSLLLWGFPERLKPADSTNDWLGEVITRKLLCYSECIAIPDWISNILDYTSYWAPGSWHSIFKNLKSCITLTISMKEFIQEGSISIFPGYEFCRTHWQSTYEGFEEQSKELLLQYRDTLEADCARLGSSNVSMLLGMMQESMFIQEKLGFLPVSCNQDFFDMGKTYFGLTSGSSNVAKWSENYTYAAIASNELVAEIRRWGSQSLFLEHLHVLHEKFDLSDPSPRNRDKVAACLREIGEKREKDRDRRKKRTDFAFGTASLIFSSDLLTVTQFLQSVGNLFWSPQPNKLEQQASNWACIIKL
jgi:hypothetical protein